jgi:hypothetical protein
LNQKDCEINAGVSGHAGFLPYLACAHDDEMTLSMLAPQPRSGALWTPNADPFS